MRTDFLISVLLILALSSCSQKPEKSAPEEVLRFIANPQPVPEQPVEPLALGSVAPDFSLPNIDGKFMKLGDFDASPILVIVFTCNHCPTAQAYEDRMIAFTKDYANKGVGVVAIMPNSVLGLLPEECGYTDLNDTYEEMNIRHKDKGYNFPYLYDGDTQAISIKYGPVATPHAFVFDKERKLVYRGRLDEHEKPGTANAEDLRKAVDEVLAGQQVSTPENKAFGCSVKWGWKLKYAEDVEKEWASRPVSIHRANSKEIKALVRNDSKKLRLINVWATWCAPCVAEYPSLLLTQRMFGQRDFEFISISTDKPEHEEKALNFLKDKHSSITNYLFEGSSYELIEALDPDWNGALPYTLLVEPGGKVVYRYQGPVDILEVKRAIVDHPMIGRYY
jgi:thiol-disulfide isomerase/thioredoxin